MAYYEYPEKVTVSEEAANVVEYLAEECGEPPDKVASDMIFFGMEEYKTRRAREAMFGENEGVPE